MTFDPSARARRALPVGVFDSGVGGLTVASAIRRRLPAEQLLYLGDLARNPYGPKSPQTLVRYTLNAADFLVGRGIKALVVACNTASAVALDAVAARFPGLPVIGVIEAGAARAAEGSATGRIIVAATEGTCRSGAYERAIARHRPAAAVTCVPCPLFVALAEEGLTDGPIVTTVARHYLAAALDPARQADCLVLGCTHFPLLAPALARLAGPEVRLVDCGEATADRLAEALAGPLAAPLGSQGGLSLIATDAPDRFARIAQRLFPTLDGLPPVELADLLHPGRECERARSA